MSDFVPGVGGINGLDFEPVCDYHVIDGCETSAIYFHRWALDCKCPKVSLLCGRHSVVEGAAWAFDRTTQWVCLECRRVTYGRASELCTAKPIPAPFKRMD